MRLPSPRPRPRFVPRLEVLEGRLVPAVTVTTRGSILLIRGDNTLHSIVILDDGTALGSNIIVRGDGQVFSPDAAVSAIVVRTGGGNDDVEYQLQQTLRSGVNRVVDVNLGGGHNAFTITLKGELQSGSGLAIRYRGGPLDDTVNGSIQDTLDANSSLRLDLGGGGGKDVIDLSFSGNTIAAGALLAMNLNGGGGPDRITVNYLGTDQGALLFNANGGAGDDQLEANLEVTTTSSKVRGLVLADEFGGSGNDDLKLAVHRLDPTSPLLVDGLVDGGPGHDRARHTANVGVLDCERVFLVP